VWLGFWKLSCDPFLGPEPVYVSTGSHDEAVARLVATVESGERFAVLRGAEGIGKSLTLARMAAEVRGPRRRLSMMTRPGDGLALLAGLAEGLGRRVSPGASRSAAWSTLAEAVRVCQWQRVHPILVVDDIQDLVEPYDRRDLARLVHLGNRPTNPLTVVQAICDSDDDLTPARPWELAVRLLPLTRSETEQYIVAKLAAARRVEPVFTPPALTRIHHLSGGVPRGIDRLASLALRAGAVDQAARVTPEVIDAVAGACLHDAA
jgi:MSHA biogenesis protein MshM